MSHPFMYLENILWLKIVVGVVLAVGFLAVGNQMMLYGEPLKIKPQAPRGMLSYYFAGDKTRAGDVLAAWEKNKVTEVAQKNLYWDYPFLIFYSTLFAFLIFLVTTGLKNYPWWVFVGFLLIYGQWLAAIFDTLENTALLFMLKKGATEVLPPLVFWLATFKWLLVLTGLLYMVVGGLIVGVLWLGKVLA